MAIRRDIISSLPDCILEDIIGRLPLQEAARTSVLSKRYTYTWTRIPQIRFDKTFCDKPLRSDRDRAMPIVSRVLSLHSGSVVKFTLTLQGLNKSDHDQIIDFLANSGVEDLHFYPKRTEWFYDLAPPIFSCVKLETLSLQSCEITLPPGFKGFEKLVSLYLYDVDIDGEALSNLVLSSPLLETITLLSINSSGGCFRIVAPKLNSLYCKFISLGLHFEYAPKLERLYINWDDSARYAWEKGEEEEEMIVPFDVLHALKYVNLNRYFLERMNLHAALETTKSDLIRLKVIRLRNISFEHKIEARNVVSLLRSSPNLEQLFVQTDTRQPDFDPALQVWKSETLSDFTLSQLREVKINICGKESELLFMEIIIAKSPMLEKMVVKRSDSCTEEERQKIIREVERICKNCSNEEDASSLRTVDVVLH